MSTIISFWVTVGIPDWVGPLASKVHVRIDTDNKNETLIKRAKEVRKEYATDQKRKPSELYWEIYTSREDTIPYCQSINAPYPPS